MSFQCPVCEQSFKRVQDRTAHIRLRRDTDHRQFALKQAQDVTRRFSETVQAATSAVTASSMRPPPSSGPTIHINDVDENDQPSSRNMDIDLDQDSDEDSDNDGPGIESEPERVMGEDEDKEDEDHMLKAMDAAARALGNIDLDDILEAFNFLPNPDLEDLPEVEPGPRPSTASYRHIRRTLIDDDAQSHTYQWHPSAGQVYGQEETIHARWKSLFSVGSDAKSDYRPFSSRLDWEIAQWAVKEKIPQKSLNRLLKIPQVKDRLDLTFSNARAMLQNVDAIPDRCGQWYTKRLSFKDRPNEFFTVRHRDPIEAIKGLWGDPSFSKDLVYKPAKMFRAHVQTEEERMYSEMWTGGFWNAAQQLIPEGGTIAPVIIASDKTQLTQFSGNKAAYPVYLTLGNIPKSLRRKPNARACVLIAYLSVDKMSKKGLSKTKLRARNYELFHRSMAIVLQSLKTAGNPKGPGVAMTGGDGAVRRVYPILTTYVADYPEQCLVTCTKHGTCPKCRRKADELGLPTPGEPRKPKWTYGVIQSARSWLQHGRTKSVYTTCMESDVAGGNYEPFWAGFPLADIHRCIAPDILHQLYQGVLKHLIGWVQEVMGEDVLDIRIRSLPPTYGVRHFKNGISGLAQVSGVERKHIARILLSCLVGKIDSKGIIACRSLLHFIHLAQYPSHDEDTLGYMQAELDTWHQNCAYFITTGTRDDFNIPKFHSLLHYIDSIRWLGTTDNYNTEMFERLHIDFAKEGWRASNKRDHFPQMVKWLSRQEKVSSYDFYRSWVDDSTVNDSEVEMEPEIEEETRQVDDQEISLAVISRRVPSVTDGQVYLAKHPAEPQKGLARIIVSHSAPGFLSQLKIFLHSLLPSHQQVPKQKLYQGTLPFTSLDVWHQYKFYPTNLSSDDHLDGIRETIKAVPISKKSLIPRFDTVIVLDTDEAESTAVQGCRVGRLKIIFRLPETINHDGIVGSSPSEWPKDPLAYVTWFTRFKASPDSNLGMYHIQPAKDSTGQEQGCIFPLTNIRQSCMLTPARATWDSNWNPENVLDQCDSFFVNNLQSKYSYQTIY